MWWVTQAEKTHFSSSQLIYDILTYFPELRYCNHIGLNGSGGFNTLELENFDKIQKIVEFYVMTANGCKNCMIHLILSMSENPFGQNEAMFNVCK